MPMPAGLDEFTQAYFVAALWSSVEDEEPLDANYEVTDFSDETFAKMVEDCRTFQEKFGHLINRDTCLHYETSPEAMGGHDFYLTRSHHGAGFWEKSDWEEEAGRQLTAAAHSYGPFDLYVGDDGKIWH